MGKKVLKITVAVTSYNELPVASNAVIDITPHVADVYSTLKMPVDMTVYASDAIDMTDNGKAIFLKDVDGRIISSSVLSFSQGEVDDGVEADIYPKMIADLESRLGLSGGDIIVHTIT